MRHVLSVLTVCLLAAAACKDAEIQDRIVSESTSGSADDGNDKNDPPVKTYPPGRQATDNTAEAGSQQPTSTSVAGFVKAIPTTPPAATKDVAEARSMNMVKTALVVNKAGAFTFDIDLAVLKPQVTRNASLSVRVRANVLDAGGATIPNAQITDIDFAGSADANGATQMDPAGSGAEPLNANGDYVKRLSGPNQGIQLQPGNYQIELEIRLVARASTAAPGGELAKVDRATATIRLR